MSGSIACSLDRLVGLGNGVQRFLPAEETPWLVVVWPECIGESPICYCAIRIIGDGILEAPYGFLVVEAVGPDEAAVEPSLGLGTGGGDRTMVGTEIVVIRGGLHDGHVVRDVNYW